MRETTTERGERLQPLAEALAKRHNFSLPYVSRNAVYPPAYYVSPFLVVTMRDDPTDFDDGHGVRQIGSSEWASDPNHAAALVQGRLEWAGWRNLRVYDVERQEQCYFEFGIRMKYNAVATLTATAGTGCFDDAPMLGSSTQKGS